MISYNEYSSIFNEYSPIFKDYSPIFNEYSPIFNEYLPIFNDYSATFNEYSPIFNATLRPRMNADCSTTLINLGRSCIPHPRFSAVSRTTTRACLNCTATRGPLSVETQPSRSYRQEGRPAIRRTTPTRSHRTPTRTPSTSTNGSRRLE